MKTKINLEIENRELFPGVLENHINTILYDNPNISIIEMLKSIQTMVIDRNLPFEVGKGGSHIWIHNGFQNSNRIGIVYFD